MTNLTKFTVLAASLSLLSAALVVPSAMAQTETKTTTKTAAPAHRAKTSRKRAKLKKEAAKDIEQGVEKANENLHK